jgi:alginate O-acetyltransferase complex protein AlgI
MLFNSMQFCVFFPAVVAVYFMLPQRVRWAFLLAASYGFYMAWEPGYVVLLWLSTAVDFVAAKRIAASTGRRRRNWLLASLGANLALLFFFKYYNFFAASLGAGVKALGFHLVVPYSEFLLPMGISFYTFQTMSYTIDVYRGRLTPETHLGHFALYVSFFPQLVAGPIERAGSLLPQLKRCPVVDYDQITDGLRLMAWGFFKKMVIADRLATVVEHVYDNPEGQSGPAILLATVCFGYQIYCDFSGYSDIAIGAARILGVRLSSNFNRPYAARSITEFWQRWHITLSTWFRDYVYVPLGGNRTGRFRWAVNILVVFMVSGLWHGANWTFVVWGLIHGTLLLAERSLARVAPASTRIPGLIKLLLTFTAVHIGWIFFRAATVTEAWTLLRRIPQDWSVLRDPVFWDNVPYTLGLYPDEFRLVFLAILVLELVQFAHARVPLQPWFRALPIGFRWACYALFFWTLFLGGVFRQTEFYYFVF